MDPAALGDKLEHIPAGVYFGWASIDGGETHKTVLSVGWNPFFQNKEKTIEPHIVHVRQSIFLFCSNGSSRIYPIDTFGLSEI